MDKKKSTAVWTFWSFQYYVSCTDIVYIILHIVIISVQYIHRTRLGTVRNPPIATGNSGNGMIHLSFHLSVFLTSTVHALLL